MKAKKVKDRKAGAVTLVVKPTKREELVYAQAEWLAAMPCEYLAEFRYEMDGGDTALYYDITGLADLKSYMKAPFGTVQYRGLLAALAEVADACTRRDFPTSGLQLDAEHVYMTPDGSPRFVYVPLSGVPANAHATPDAFLQGISSAGSPSFVVPDDARHAEALFDYVKRNPVFSLSSYRAFLSSEFHIAQASVSSGPLSRAAASAGGRASGRLAASSAAPSARSAGGAGGSYAAAFDPIALLRRSPSAAQVEAGESVAGRVRLAVADVSPTAAPSVSPADVSSAFGKGASAAAPAPAPTPAPMPMPASASVPAPMPAPAPSASIPAPAPAPVPTSHRASASASAPASEPANASPAPAAVSAPVPTSTPAQAPMPSAAPAPMPMPAPSAPTSAPAPAVPAPAPGPAPAPSASIPTPSPAAAPAPEASRPGGTTLLGAGVLSRASSSVASGFAPADFFLVRDSDGSRYRMPGETACTVGRSSSCDVRIEGNPGISRVHARVRRDGSSFEVVDLGSANGTFVAGRRLSKGQAACVREGERFKLADEAFRFAER